MAIKVTPKHGVGKINRFEKGESGNYKGRPRKYICTLKQEGYKLVEIKDAMKKVLSLHDDELTEFLKDKKLDVLTQMLVSGIKTSIKKGDLSALEILLNRSFGKPKEDVEIAHSIVKIPDSIKEVSNNDIEAAQFYQEIIKK